MVVEAVVVGNNWAALRWGGQTARIAGGLAGLIVERERGRD